ncbi:MAG: prolyl oligopeptidase family serine peptidase, partial [Pseudomonadales bacterium]|nr:prolyl oligopeptidase family serine peptidase [Pseudomonadales bacterium]
MPFHFDESNQFVYVLLRSDFIDNYGLYKMDIDSLELTEIHQPEQVDLRPSDGIFDTNGLLVGIAERDSTFEYHYFDTDNGVVRWHEMLTRAFKDQLVRFTSFTDDGSTAIVLVGSDTNPGDFYFFDTESKRADYLFSRAEWLTPDDMATVKPISYRASDGLVIDGYVTRLKTTEGPGPMVVIPHGGPAARDFWTYYAAAQLLASRGYTVLQMNFRGSDGYGLKHRNAGNKKWGSRIQQDIAEGTGWAIDEGFADENRICIYGGSFGAYSALMNVILYPDLYRCAIGLAGMYDFETQRTRSDTAEFEMADGFFERVFGDDKQSAIDFSPVYHTSKIKVPV